MVLASYHSSYFYQTLMRGIRASLEAGTFDSFRSDFLSRYQANGS